MAKKYRYIVRVTVNSEDKLTKKQVREMVQAALENWSLKAKAGAVDIQ